jgi:hypothetical protein
VIDSICISGQAGFDDQLLDIDTGAVKGCKLSG